jgi:excisionase family DNA binding protein
MKTSKKYFITSEVAELFAVSVKTVRRWAKKGKLPVVVTLGGHYRFPKDEVKNILSQHRRGGCGEKEENLNR